MYYNDFKKIDELLGRIKKLIDEIPKDIKSNSSFLANGPLHEVLSLFVNQIEETLRGEEEKDNEYW